MQGFLLKIERERGFINFSAFLDKTHLISKFSFANWLTSNGILTAAILPVINRRTFILESVLLVFIERFLIKEMYIISC